MKIIALLVALTSSVNVFSEAYFCKTESMSVSGVNKNGKISSNASLHYKEDDYKTFILSSNENGKFSLTNHGKNEIIVSDCISSSECRTDSTGKGYFFHTENNVFFYTVMVKGNGFEFALGTFVGRCSKI